MNVLSAGSMLYGPCMSSSHNASLGQCTVEEGLVLAKIAFVNVCVTKIVALFGKGIFGDVAMHVLLQSNPSVSVAAGRSMALVLNIVLLTAVSLGGDGDGAGPEPSCIQVKAG